jgi:hypothetical protein
LSYVGLVLVGHGGVVDACEDLPRQVLPFLSSLAVMLLNPPRAFYLLST